MEALKEKLNPTSAKKEQDNDADILKQVMDPKFLKTLKQNKEKEKKERIKKEKEAQKKEE